MRGDAKVIDCLNESLKAELTAILQYVVHAEMCEDWGYHRLGAFTKKQAIDEMRHSEKIIERILFLDGTPKIAETFPVKVGATVKNQLENDLALELEAVSQYNAFVKIAADAGDDGSRELFERHLTDEEEHVDHLEAQLGLIEQVGLENYLAQQMHQKEEKE